MIYKVFIDANVFLEAYLDRKHKAESIKFLTLLSEHQISGFTSSSVLQICAYFLEKEMDTKSLKRLFLSLLDYVRIIDAQQETVTAALHSASEDIEDAILYYTALHRKLDYFISFDKEIAKFSSQSLPVFTPQQFFAATEL